MNPQMQQEMEAESKKEKILHMRLSDTDKGELFALSQRPATLHALEKAFLACAYEWGTVRKEDDENVTINWAMSIANSNKTTEEKGRTLEVIANAVAVMQDALKQIKKFGEEKVVQQEEVNPAI